MKVAFAGLSHLGVCMSIAAHKSGLEILAFDLNHERAARVAAGEFDTAEPGAVEFLQSHPDNFCVSTDARELADVDLVIITVDTELTSENDNDETEVAELIACAARQISKDIPMVIASQVRPGFTRLCVPTHRLMFYLMESLIFGQGIERARFPERYVVGCGDAAMPLPPSLRSFLALPNCPVHVMGFESAEFTKLAANYLLSASITAANSLAELSSLLGADWSSVENALRDDERIGQHAYISAGLGIGGANLNRDLHGIQELSNRLGANSTLVSTMLNHSEYMKNWCIRTLSSLRQTQDVSKLGVLGLAYKPGTQSMRGSVGWETAELFSSISSVGVHDFAVRLSPSTLHKFRIREFDDPLDCIQDVDVILISTPYSEYRKTIDCLKDPSRKTTILDPYRLLDPAMHRKAGTELIQLGEAQ